jgi:hypothetical protein
MPGIRPVRPGAEQTAARERLETPAKPQFYIKSKENEPDSELISAPC